MDKKTLVVLLDADGCYYNRKYEERLWYVIARYRSEIEFIAKHPDMTGNREALERIRYDAITATIPKDILHNVPTEKKIALFNTFTGYLDQLIPGLIDVILWRENKILIEKLAKDVTEKNIGEIILMVGSARQSFSIDDYNNKKFGTRSFFPSLEKFASMLHEKFSKELSVAVSMETFLLSDLYSNVQPGESYRRIMMELINHAPQSQCNSVHDKSKFTLVYAALNHLAQKYSEKYLNNELLVEYFDDTAFIHDSLMRASSKKHADLMLPENIPLYLYLYMGDKISENEMHLIQGKGKPDRNFAEKCKQMMKICRKMASDRVGIDVANQLDFMSFMQQKASVNPILAFFRKCESVLSHDAIIRHTAQP